MIINSKSYIFLISLLFFSSCKEEKNLRVFSNNYELIVNDKFEHKVGEIVRLWSDDSLIYISNAPEFGIYVYSMDGNFIKRTGKKGPAPWEHGTLWHFSRDSIYYWVHDYPKQAIKKYLYLNDSLLISTKIITSNNVQFIGHDKFIVPRIEEKTNDFLLSVFDVKTENFIRDIDILEGIQKIDKSTKKYSAFIFEGGFCNNDRRCLYYCYDAEIAFLIDKNTFKFNLLHDFRGYDIPKAVVKNNMIHLKPKAFIRLDACLDNECIYVLTNNLPEQPVRKSTYFYIDIYDIETLRYTNSIIVPKGGVFNFPIKIAKIKNGIVIGYRNSEIITYSLKKNKDVE